MPRFNRAAACSRRVLRKSAAIFARGLSRKIHFAFAVLLGLLSTATQSGFAQGPLTFENNFFVTGDYVVAGAYGMNNTVTHNGTLYTNGTINVPDQCPVAGLPNCPVAGLPNPGITGATSVPMGAQIVAAFLYWETVESASITPPQPGSGAIGFFRPVNGPLYPIQGTNLPSQNTVAWSNGGCPSTSTGRVVRVYRADVRGLLPQDGKGNVLANSQYQVLLPSSTNGSPPITLGATLVIIYRVLSPSVPLNSIVIYDGAFGQSSSSLIMTQTVPGFYDAAKNPVSRLTHIVGSGQSNKYQNVYLNNPALNNPLPILYGGQAAFPGWYGDWDNPTWTFGDPNYPQIQMANPVQEDSASATTTVVPSSSQQGCVVWGAVIVATTVKNTDGDGLLDVWKTNQGYCDVAVNPNTCTGSSDASWVPLPNASQPGRGKDIFVQLDYMVNPNTGISQQPDPQAVAMMESAFTASGTNRPINLHIFPTWAIQEQTCSDANNNNVLCAYPDQSGVVAWKSGLAFLKNQLVDPTGNPSTCTTTPPPLNCAPRFQHGKKDSYHYVLFGHALGFLTRTLQGGSLISVQQSSNTVTFTTAVPNGLVVDQNAGMGRVNVSGAITNPALNGTYRVQTVPATPCVNVRNPDGTITCGPTSFTIQIGGSAINTSYTLSTDPNLAFSSGQAQKAGGMADIGGQDSVITLGLWDPASVTIPVQAGTFMHELGHSLGLTHGGFYYDTAGSYVPTAEANCKTNYQSVMNYGFQVAPLQKYQNGTLVNVVDYSEEQLITLNEASVGSVGALTTVGGNPATYLNAQWFSLAPPNGVGTAATLKCNGDPVFATDPPMYQLVGLASSLPWPIYSTSVVPPYLAPTLDSNGDLDIDYNGKIEIAATPPPPYGLRGYDDWANIDLRQVGATGSLSTATQFGSTGGAQFGSTGGAQFGSTGGAQFGSAGGAQFGSTGGAQFGSTGGAGIPEIDENTANSVTRPPTQLTASEGVSPRTITLNWVAPTFGNIGTYNIYRSTDNGVTFNPKPLTSVPGAQLTYSDTVTCNPTGYKYFVTAVLAGSNPPQESVQSNTAPPGPPLLTGCYTNTPGTVALNPVMVSGSSTVGSFVPITWTLQDDDTGVFVSRLQANTHLVAIGPVANDQTCGSVTSIPAGTTRTTLLSNGVVNPNYSTSTFGVSQTNKFTFSWDTKPFITGAGCWFFELDLDSGQSKTTTSPLTLLMWGPSANRPYVLTATLQAVVNKSYSPVTLQESGGTSPFAWTVWSGSLPPGILLNSSTGTLSGKPTQTGIYNFTLQVSDVKGNYGRQAFTFTVTQH
jgi:hypothetical protein